MTRSLAEEIRLTKTLPAPDEARALRVRAGVSQVRMASELGISRVTLHRWETGVHRPRGEQRIAYAELLGDLRQELGDE